MSFALSGLTVTQSGVDTSYDGLTGIPGVTAVATGDGFLYLMPTLEMWITGQVTIADPSKESFLAKRFEIRGTGSLRSGSFADNGVTPLTSGTHFQTVSDVDRGDAVNNPDAAAFTVRSGGKFTTIGGNYSITNAAYIENGATIREYSTSAVATKAWGSTASARIRAFATDVELRDCRHYDIGYDMFRVPAVYAVKGFGAEYVAQYVGSEAGGDDARFTASALSNVDGVVDFDNYGYGWVELYNCAKGANLNVVCTGNASRHIVPLFQDILLSVTDLAANQIAGVRFKLIDAPVNSPTSAITTASNLKIWDFRSPQTYTGTTDASGKVSVSPVLQVWYTYGSNKNLRFPNSTAIFKFRGYEAKEFVSAIVLGSDTPIERTLALTRVAFLTITEAQAAALTGIALTPSGATGGTLTVTEPRTVAEIWQFYRQWIAQLAQFDSADTWSFDGVRLDTGAWAIADGGNISGIYSSPAGTSALVTVAGLVDGTRVQIFDTAEIANMVVSGGAGYSGRFTWSTDKTIRLRATYANGLDARLPLQAFATFTQNGASFSVTQVEDAVYIANGINGSTASEFTADFPNVQIDINDPDGQTTVQRLYAWWRWNTTSAAGIRDFFGGLVADDRVNYRVATAVLNLQIDNTGINSVRVIGGRIYRDDGGRLIAPGSGSVELDPDKVYAVGTSGSGAGASPADVWDYVLTGTATAGSLLRQVPAVKAKTDALPAAPASEGNVSAVGTAVALTASGAALAGLATNVEAVKAKTDQLPADPASAASVAAPADIWAHLLASDRSAADLVKIIAAFAAGKTSIESATPGQATVTYRSVDDTHVAISGQMTGSERTSVTLTP